MGLLLQSKKTVRQLADSLSWNLELMTKQEAFCQNSRVGTPLYSAGVVTLDYLSGLR